jgi:hypothetical protein
MQYHEMQEDDPKLVVEPDEVLPPLADGQPINQAGPSAASLRFGRLGRAVLSGLLLDLADFASPVPYLAVYGLLVGWYVARTQKVPAQQRIWWIAASVLYCAVPRTGFYPLATLFLVYRALRDKE